MADFLHCNACLRMPSRDTTVIQFYVTGCHNVFCVSKCTQNCAKCAPNGCQVIPLNNDAHEDIKMCFKDVTKTSKVLDRVKDFQKRQWIRLNAALTAENNRLRSECIDHKNTIERLNQKVMSLETQLATRSPLPKSGFNCHPFLNTSPANESLFKHVFESMPKNETMSLEQKETNLGLNLGIMAANRSQATHHQSQQPVLNSGSNALFAEPMSPTQSSQSSQSSTKASRSHHKNRKSHMGSNRESTATPVMAPPNAMPPPSRVPKRTPTRSAADPAFRAQLNDMIGATAKDKHQKPSHSRRQNPTRSQPQIASYAGFRRYQ
ncbi:unnamed protein product [Oppiella nova]|uniref:RING-type domain-containing protein n=1 Tax=Oppiella nova TaxID=334625 RepID=A0A7R9QE43_9ACAR|nr:unnamed protein product [Oppiella nova]CAG2164064.1 unnamed protein product [Oppiella nova]